MTKCLIIDDERLARQELRSLLESHKELEIIGEATNGNEAVEKINELQPDLVFLDIEMPGKNGFEVLENCDFAPNVIFITAYDQFAIKAFEANALDYILKPIIPDRLEQSLSKYKTSENQSEKNDETKEDKLDGNAQIFIKDGEKCWFVKLKEVRLFESEGNYIRLYFGSNRPLILKSLNKLEERLDPKHFFRISRKHMINLDFVEKVDSWFNGSLRVTLNSGEQLEISRRQSAKFKEMLSL